MGDFSRENNLLPRYLSKQLAAKYLSISIRQLSDWISQNYFPIIRVGGGHIKIDRQDIDRFMSDNKILIPDNVNKILEEYTEEKNVETIKTN